MRIAQNTSDPESYTYLIPPSVISDFSQQHNLDVQFESVGLSGKRHPLEVETAIFRVVQESLTNVLLHARATRVDVLLSQRKEMLNVIVEDNGVGFVPENVAKHTHLGLFGMRERVEMLGGKLTIESSIGKGTTKVFAKIMFEILKVLILYGIYFFK